MREYPKIQSVFKRHREGERKGRFIEGEWTCPEFEYLAKNRWVFQEKCDGTNVRVHWDGAVVRIGGRTDRAQMFLPLVERVQELFPADKFRECFTQDREDEQPNITLYGEGYGAKIQKGGGNYKPDGVDFVLFDIRIGEWWLMDDKVVEVADRMGIQSIPVLGTGSLYDAIGFVRGGITSAWGFEGAEGVVCRPEVPLRFRRGDRVITKIKTGDFR